MKQCVKYAVGILALLLTFGGQATAQATSYTVAAYSGAATDPATATPIATPVTYLVSQLTCGQAKISETLPIVNPYEGRVDDPANAALDCAVPIESQMLALPVGSGYKVAYRIFTGTVPSAWSPFTTAFAITAPQIHPCDGTPPTTGTVVEGTRTLSWCWNGLDVNGSATIATVWTATIDGVRTTLTSVQVGATANAQGKRLYSATIPLVRGSRAVRVAATNAVGEAVFSATFTVTVTVPAGVPTVSEIRGIQ